jgi:hypothetical protein
MIMNGKIMVSDFFPKFIVKSKQTRIKYPCVQWFKKNIIRIRELTAVRQSLSGSFCRFRER